MAPGRSTRGETRRRPVCRFLPWKACGNSFVRAAALRSTDVFEGRASVCEAFLPGTVRFVGARTFDSDERFGASYRPAAATLC